MKRRRHLAPLTPFRRYWREMTQKFEWKEEFAMYAWSLFKFFFSLLFHIMSSKILMLLECCQFFLFIHNFNLVGLVLFYVYEDGFLKTIFQSLPDFLEFLNFCTSVCFPWQYFILMFSKVNYVLIE